MIPGDNIDIFRPGRWGQPVSGAAL